MAEKFRTEPMLVSSNVSMTALKANGTVWTSGQNISGALGDPTLSNNENRYTPGRVVGPNGEGYLKNVKYISGYNGAMAAILDDGTLWMWGTNTSGQLGVGEIYNYSAVPIQVKGVNGDGYLQNVKKVCVGYQYTLALTEDGYLYAWGNDSHENVLQINSTTPTRLATEFNNIVDISNHAGNRSAHFVLSNGTAYGWGRGGYTGTNSVGSEIFTEPRVVMNNQNSILTNVVKTRNNSAITSDDLVWSWGINLDGCLGIGSNDRSIIQASAIKINLSNVKEINGYNQSNFALTNSGDMYAWGTNYYGTFGIDSSIVSYYNIPTKIPISDVMCFGYGHHTKLVFAKSDGTVWSVGMAAKNFGNNNESGSTHNPQPILTETGGSIIFNLLDDDEEPIAPPDPDPSDCDGNGCCCCCKPSIQFNVPLSGKNKDTIRGMYELFETLEDDCCKTE